MHSLAENRLFSERVGKLYRHYLFPTLVAMASNSLYCLADVYFVSKGAGSSGLAAMNIAMPLFTIFSAIGLTLGVGAATVMSIAEGIRQPVLRNQAFTACLVGLLGIGMVFSIGGTIGAEPFAYLLGSSEELLPQVKQYMLPVNAAAILFIMNYAGSVLLRNDHAPRLAMTATMAGNVSNIVLDYVFVMVLGGGVFGAAMATAIGPIVSLSIMSWHFIRRHNSVHLHRNFMDAQLWKRILNNGCGSGILEISAGSIILIFNYVILQKADAMFLAAYAIVTNIAFVGKGLLNGFAQAAQPIISANHGAMLQERTKAAFHISLWYSGGFALLAYLLFLLFPSPIAAVFAGGDAQLITAAAEGIRLYFSSLFFTAVITMFLYYFQSIEQGKLATFLAFLKGFVFVIVCLFLLVSLFGIEAIWFTVALAEGLAVLSAMLFAQKRGL